MSKCFEISNEGMLVHCIIRSYPVLWLSVVMDGSLVTVLALSLSLLGAQS
jgi:hypothetical protein